jgi:hypothetical protein
MSTSESESKKSSSSKQSKKEKEKEHQKDEKNASAVPIEEVMKNISLLFFEKFPAQKSIYQSFS